MRLPAHTLTMALTTAVFQALVTFGSEPLPTELLGDLAAPGITIGGVALLLGMWVAGIASTVAGCIGVVWLAWQMWSARQQSRVRPGWMHDKFR